MKIPMNLIYKEAHRGGFTGMELDDRIGLASLRAVEAARDHNPDKGRYSTLAVTYIRNSFRDEASKHSTRQKYDGIQVSALEPSQIPACHKSPNPEQQAIFRDSLSKMSEDATHLANLALHTPKECLSSTGKNITKSLQKHLGWTNYRFKKAADEIRAIF